VLLEINTGGKYFLSHDGTILFQRSSIYFFMKPVFKNECVTGSHFATAFRFASWRGSAYWYMGMCRVGYRVFCL